LRLSVCVILVGKLQTFAKRRCNNATSTGFTRQRNGEIMTARIYLPTRNAMQSGQAKDKWLLEYEPAVARQIEPLMGWTSSTDMKSQIKLRFDSKEEAIAYAERNGIAYRLEEPKLSIRKAVSYSDNFKTNRAIPWSH
jgi:hypothetical protein